MPPTIMSDHWIGTWSQGKRSILQPINTSTMVGQVIEDYIVQQHDVRAAGRIEIVREQIYAITN